MKPKHLAWPALLRFVWNAIQLAVWPVIGLIWLISTGKFNSLFLLITMGVVVIVAVVGSGWYYARFTYAITANGITIERGLFVRKTSHIPYDKIQTVQRKQWFFLRPLGVEQVTIETAGKSDDDGEGQLALVPVCVADQINAYRSDQRVVAPTVAASTVPTATASADDQTPLYQINWSDLCAYAATSLGIVPIIIVLGWLYGKISRLVPERQLSQVEHQLLMLRGGWLIGLVVGILLLGILISFIGGVATNYHFTLRQVADTLTMSHGYFKKTTVSVHTNRIQAVSFKQNVLRQWLKLRTVQVLTAGQAGEEDDDDQLVLMPVVKAEQAYPVMAPFISWLPQTAPALTTVQPKRRWNFVRNCVLVWAVGLGLLTIPIVIWLPAYLAIYLWSWLGWFTIAIAQGTYAAHSAGVTRLSADLLVLQTGSLFTRKQTVVPHRKIQSIETNQSIWMRHAKTAHLTVKIRSGNGTETIEVRYLELATVRAIEQWYLKNLKMS